MELIVIIIIAANILVSLKGLQDFSFFEKYKFQVGAIQRGEKIRLLTSGFLHADYMHLGFNMYALYVFSGGVIRFLGTESFALVYFGSLLVGGLFSLYYNKNNYYYSAVGASGAVSGIVYSAILLQPAMSLYMFPLPIPIPAIVFGVGYLLYSIYGMKKQLGNIGHSAHLGGAIGGFVLTLFIHPQVVSKSPLMVGLLALPILLLLFLDKKK